MGNKKRIPISFHNSLQDRGAQRCWDCWFIFSNRNEQELAVSEHAAACAVPCPERGCKGGLGGPARCGNAGHDAHRVWLQTKADVAGGEVSAQACESREEQLFSAVHALF